MVLGSGALFRLRLHNSLTRQIILPQVFLCFCQWNGTLCNLYHLSTRQLNFNCQRLKVCFLLWIENYKRIDAPLRLHHQVLKGTLKTKSLPFFVQFSNHSLHFVAKWLKDRILKN